MGGNRTSRLIAVDDTPFYPPTPYTKDDLKVMHMYLPDFISPTHSTKSDQEAILMHWDKLFSQASDAATSESSSSSTPAPIVLLFDNFYKYLFELAPEVKPMFRSSMKVQGRALVRIVGSIKTILQSPDIITFAAGGASRHVNYGIKPPYFNYLGIALMKTLQSCSEALWTTDVIAAWRRVYCQVALIVLVELSIIESKRRRTSFLRTLGSQRELSVASNSHPGMTLDPNATCPVSGNRLSTMPRRNRSQSVVIPSAGLGSRMLGF